MSGSAQQEEVPSTLYWLLAVLVALLSVAAYTGYVLYPRFDLPAATGIGLLVLSAGAGIASFFAPCSFPLLVTLLAREVGAEGTGRNGRALRFASALSLGATTFLVLVGGGLALGGGALFSQVTFTSTAGITIRTVVGVLLIVLGLVQAGVIRGGNAFRAIGHLARPLTRAQARLRRENPTLGFGVYGFGYLLAGFGWTGPILAGLAGQAVTTGGFAASFFAFLVAALTIILLMFGLAFAIGSAQEGLVDRLKSSAPAVKRWGAYILVFVGVWFITLGVFASYFEAIFPV